MGSGEHGLLIATKVQGSGSVCQCSLDVLLCITDVEDWIYT